MAPRGLLAAVILLSLPWLMPFGVLAEDTNLSEFVEVNLGEPPQEPPTDPLPPAEPTAPESAQQPPEETPPAPEEPVLQVLLAPTENEEPELVFGCVNEFDAEGNEVERCGTGYYRTLCGYNAGVEECITFFELNVEEEEESLLTYDIERLRSREHFTLHLNWNGMPLPQEDAAVPRDTPGVLGWSYTTSLPEHHGLPPSFSSTYAELLAAATLTLQIYEGPIGDAALIYSEEVPHGGSGEIPFTFSDSTEYRIILSATYPFDAFVPGYVCGGELCLNFEPRIESLTWFMEHAIAYYDDIYDAIDESNYFSEYGVTKARMATFEPLVSDMRELGIAEVQPGISSVMFLPGIKGSRLYRPTDSCDPTASLSCPAVKLWEPSGSILVQDLFLTQEGVSARDDIYVRESDILAEALGSHFYASFVNQMNALEAEGVFIDWRAAAYDWRLSLDEIVTKGVKREDRIYFNEVGEVPYLEATLRELAASSATGKVSIIAHSNGGLVAKRLMQELENKGAAELVDKIIFVGVPQSGAPQALAGLLYGYGEALPLDQCAENPFTGWLCSLLGSRAVARELAEHSPMAYHLLPSERYFEQVRNGANTPVASFSATTEYFEERTKYGQTLDTTEELYSFLRAEDGGRPKPDTSDTSQANVLSTNLLSYGRTIHQSIDAWSPPTNVQVYQIAGWGMPTIAGIEFYEQRKLFGGTKEMYRPIFVEDGDGVVPVSSAMMLGESTNITNLWLDLSQLRSEHSKYDHGNIFEADDLRIAIRDLLLGDTLSSVNYISESQPSQSSQDHLLFFLHSPLTLELYDSAGRHTGETETGIFENNIPEAEYGVFGDVKYIIAPADTYTVKLNGTDSGTFSLDVQRISSGERSSQITFADIPTTAETIATFAVEPSLEQAGALKVDIDGNGQLDIELSPELNESVHYSQTPTTANSGSKRTKTSSTATQDSQEPVPAIPQVMSLINPLLVKAPATSTIFAERQTRSAAQLNQEEEILKTVSSSQEYQNLTASVYDSVGTEMLRWFGAVLYNLWTGFVVFLSSFF